MRILLGLISVIFVLAGIPLTLMGVLGGEFPGESSGSWNCTTTTQDRVQTENCYLTDDSVGQPRGDLAGPALLVTGGLFAIASCSIRRREPGQAVAMPPQMYAASPPYAQPQSQPQSHSQSQPESRPNQ